MHKRAKRRAETLAALTGQERLLHVMHLQGHLSTWQTALNLQAERVANPRPFLPKPSEIWLYASALGSTLRCIGLAERLGADVIAARERFDQAVPNGVAVRDVIEHLEDYMLGVGDRQAEGGPVFGFVYRRGLVGHDWRVQDEIQVQSVDRITLNVTTAQDAITALVDEVMAELQTLREALVERHGPWKPPARPDLDLARKRQVEWVAADEPDPTVGLLPLEED